jgi:hypothetical protein
MLFSSIDERISDISFLLIELFERILSREGNLSTIFPIFTPDSGKQKDKIASAIMIEKINITVLYDFIY